MKDIDLTWVCPYCKHEKTFKTSFLVTNPDITCSNCGKVSGVNADDLREGFEKAEKLTREHIKRMKKLSTRK